MVVRLLANIKSEIKGVMVGDVMDAFSSVDGEPLRIIHDLKAAIHLPEQ